MLAVCPATGSSTASVPGVKSETASTIGPTKNRIRPNGSTGPGTDKNFTFRRWSQPIGPLDNVPYAALTHMFWWDNRRSVGHIEDLRLGGIESTGECQFLVGTASSTFSSGYRAYHENPMFIHNHTLWWRRGLGGSSGTLITPMALLLSKIGTPR